MKVTQFTTSSTEIELADGTCVLFSYSTPVAALVPGRGWLRTSKFFSATTSKHINKWIGKNMATNTQAVTVDQWEIEKLVAF